MDIKYLGHSSFFIRTKNARVVTDPYDSGIGMKFPKTEADIVTVSHQHPDHNASAAIGGSPLILDWPGEFEKDSVRFFGIRSYHDKKKGDERGENVLYKIQSEGISILHCGDLGHLLDDTLLGQIGDIDILMVPVGGFFTIDAKEAAAVVKAVDPSIVIPMHYNHAKLDQKTFEKVSGIEDFLKQMGIEKPEPVAKLTVKDTDFEGNMKVVVMEITS